MLADGYEQLQITDSPELETEPAWSPDGTMIAYRSTGDADSNIFLVPASGGISVPITLAGEQRLPTWTPNGDHIVFVHHSSVSDRPDLYSVRPDGTELLPLVMDEVPGGSLHPAFLTRR